MVFSSVISHLSISKETSREGVRTFTGVLFGNGDGERNHLVKKSKYRQEPSSFVILFMGSQIPQIFVWKRVFMCVDVFPDEFSFVVFQTWKTELL